MIWAPRRESRAVRYDLTWAGLAPADRASLAGRLLSFDHLVGAGEQHRRDFEAKRLRHDQVNDEVEGRLLDPKIGRLRPPQNLSTKSAGAPGPLKSVKTTVPTGVENSYFS